MIKDIVPFNKIGCIKINCFAYGYKNCYVLTELVCKKKKCSFFKTKEQYNADLIKYPWIYAKQT